MCGVFGVVLGQSTSTTKTELIELIHVMFKQSYSRGKEASGIAIRSQERISMFKAPLSALHLLKDKVFKAWLERELDQMTDSSGVFDGPISVLGHARLMTNGMQGIQENNQPVRTENTIAVHNGIIVNEAALTAKHKDVNRNASVDSELIPLLVDKYLDGGDTIPEALDKILEETVGQVTTIVMRADRPGLAIATNISSLYTFEKPDTTDAFLCMSEGVFLEKVQAQSRLAKRLFGASAVRRAATLTGMIVDESGTVAPLNFREGETSLSTPNVTTSEIHKRAQLFDEQTIIAERRINLKRCTKCVLPETIPSIIFDDAGVCNYCRDHVPFTPKGLDALYEALKPYRRTDGQPELIMGLSGGRDSSYGVHYVKKELGINVVSYTYDWALVTDLARRNTSRMCAALEMEHVLVSADIKQKRGYIRDNINAWIAKPQLGMVPLFMAGDKLFFYYYNEVKKQIGVDLAITCGNHYEKTDFKSGFCGVYNRNTGGEGKSWRPYDVSWMKKARYLAYFAWHMGTNPKYMNASLFDNAKGFYSSYVMDHNFIWLYDYLPWDEDAINSTLKNEYDWETATDTESTWRVGDGTAAFYNYIYMTAAGFSEHDTFRSNQIREGTMTREEAMRLITRDNVPRYDTILEYSNLIGFDFDRAMAAINQMPKLY